MRRLREERIEFDKTRGRPLVEALEPGCVKWSTANRNRQQCGRASHPAARLARKNALFAVRGDAAQAMS
jgi:hypothetical protein